MTSEDGRIPTAKGNHPAGRGRGHGEHQAESQKDNAATHHRANRPTVGARSTDEAFTWIYNG